MPHAHPVPIKELSRIAGLEFPWLEASSLQLLAQYISELLIWNRKTNLIGKQDWASAYHFLIKDSLYLAGLLTRLDLPAQPLTLDLGAGAGLPGIPLRIVWPAGEYVLVEPRQKRALFLHHAVRLSSLLRTRVRMCRAEELREHPADLIISRAMCPWTELLDLAGPLLSSQGRVVIFSNQAWDAVPNCPDGWELCLEESYPAGDQVYRYFWVFSPIT
ncbi:MAG: 16S rRNA (guanine(527)-N(7))-methyltransferase RsmG [Desulfovermiculus sp.]